MYVYLVQVGESWKLLVWEIEVGIIFGRGKLMIQLKYAEVKIELKFTF